jgi:hypothetical protein
LIYTTYFAKLRSLPENIVPISICGKAPAGYKGLQYKKLAPKFDFFMDWKLTGDNEQYIKCFKEQVLAGLNANEVVFELNDAVYYINGTDMDIALVCYEKPTDFCHRHLVAEWLREHGYQCEEYKYDT